MYFKQLSRAEHCDKVMIVGENLMPLMQCSIRIRFKQSGLSGDEWRISTMWQLAENGGEWQDLDGSNGGIETACQLAFGKFYSFSQTPTLAIGSIFSWKNNLVYISSESGDIQNTPAIPTLSVLAFLPSDYIHAAEDGPGLPKDWYDYCFQPGCYNKAVSTYKIKTLFSSCGEQLHEKEQGVEWHRRFCQRHLDRGDASREDSNDNYEVVSGPGPAEQDWRHANISVPEVVAVNIDNMDELPEKIKEVKSKLDAK